MSRKQRAQEQQKKRNSPAQKEKRAKKIYYASYVARQDWQEKKARKRQEQIKKRVERGISVHCYLEPWEEPSTEKCTGCRYRCSFKGQ